MKIVFALVAVAGLLLLSSAAEARTAGHRNSWVGGRYHHHAVSHKAYAHRRYVHRPYSHHHRTPHGQRRSATW